MQIPTRQKQQTGALGVDARFAESVLAFETDDFGSPPRGSLVAPVQTEVITV
jgi:hypothetical protein